MKSLNRYHRLVCCLSLVALSGALPLATAAAPKIAWYGDLDMGLAVAKQRNRPILLISGAPHCHGVPGLW